jgi:hypothetical protein
MLQLSAVGLQRCRHDVARDRVSVIIIAQQQHALRQQSIYTPQSVDGFQLYIRLCGGTNGLLITLSVFNQSG